MTDTTRWEKMAAVAIGTGLDLQQGQDLVITAPVDALPLVRALVAEAYKAGAGVVTPLLSDDAVTLARFEHATDESLDRAADWLFAGMAQAFENGAARLAVAGGNPMLLSEQDPARVARASKANAIASKPAMRYISNFEVNWNIVAYPNPAWARLVFPDLSEEDAVARLTDAIFAASRLDGADPVADWKAHAATLAERRDWLNAQAFDALHFKGPGTDLRVGLAEDHVWMGGEGVAKNGVHCLPNIPTEEVFTCPDNRRVEGFVRASKPLAHQGTLIEDIAVRFEAGRIVEASASRGEDVFLQLIDSDEGARRLGEVALVPHSSPISQTGLLFYNTLFDENAACHIALGQCYGENIKGGTEMTDEERAAKGGNASVIHVDWMIGSGEIDIDGLAADGSRTPVFRAGEWA